MDGKKVKRIMCRTLFWMGIALIVIFGFMLICNLIVIIKNAVKPDEPSGIFGIMPMVVESGSMSGEASDHIEVDDLIFVTEAEPEKLEVGDIIAYKSKDGIIVTHRIVEIETDDQGGLHFTTKGDANNVADEPVGTNALIGVYRGRIPKVGRVIMFLQTPIGIVTSLGVPIIIFFVSDILYRHRQKKKNRE